MRKLTDYIGLVCEAPHGRFGKEFETCIAAAANGQMNPDVKGAYDIEVDGNRIDVKMSYKRNNDLIGSINLSCYAAAQKGEVDAFWIFSVEESGDDVTIVDAVEMTAAELLEAGADYTAWYHSYDTEDPISFKMDGNIGPHAWPIVMNYEGQVCEIETEPSLQMLIDEYWLDEPDDLYGSPMGSMAYRDPDDESSRDDEWHITGFPKYGDGVILRSNDWFPVRM